MGELKGVGMVGEVLWEVGLVDDLDHAGLGLLRGGRGVGHRLVGGGRGVDGPGGGVDHRGRVVDGPGSGVDDGCFVDGPGSLLVTLWKEV